MGEDPHLLRGCGQVSGCLASGSHCCWDTPLPCIGAGVTAFSAIFFSQPQTRWAYPLDEAEESDTEVDTTLF